MSWYDNVFLMRGFDDRDDSLDEAAYERLQEEFDDDFSSNIYNHCEQKELDAFETPLLKIAKGDNSDATREVFNATLRNAYNSALDRYKHENFNRVEKELRDEYESDRAEAMID